MPKNLIDNANSMKPKPLTQGQKSITDRMKKAGNHFPAFEFPNTPLQNKAGFDMRKLPGGLNDQLKASGLKGSKKAKMSVAKSGIQVKFNKKNTAKNSWGKKAY